MNQKPRAHINFDDLGLHQELKIIVAAKKTTVKDVVEQLLRGYVKKNQKYLPKSS